MKELLTGGKQCFYTIFHPFNGFDQVKWEKKGSPKFCLLILLAFFLTSVFTPRSHNKTSSFFFMGMSHFYYKTF